MIEIVDTSLNGARYFSSEILQNYIIFLPTKEYLRLFTNTSKVYSWKSKGFSEESIENIITSDINFVPTLVIIYQRQILMDIV